MNRNLHRLLRRFRKDETGNMTIEFVLFFTLFFTLLATGTEIAYMNLRHSMLERGVELATREIRLSTGGVPSYNEVRTAICEKSAILADCESNLQLEMVQVDPRNFSGLASEADCVNAEEEPRPVRNFVAGQDNELMLMRACLKYKPFMPTVGLGKTLHKDDQGYAQLIVTSAFVQEPR